MLGIFLCASCTFVCLIWRKVYLGFLPIFYCFFFPPSFFFFKYWAAWAIIVELVWRLILISCFIRKYFSHMWDAFTSCLWFSLHIPWENLIQKDTCTQKKKKRPMRPNVHWSTVIIARIWKQPKCPLTDKWIRCTMNYYTAIKRRKIGSFLELWMDLKSIIQSEVSQKEKSIYSILRHVCGIQKNGTGEPVCREK